LKGGKGVLGKRDSNRRGSQVRTKDSPSECRMVCGRRGPELSWTNVGETMDINTRKVGMRRGEKGRRREGKKKSFG